MEEINFLLEDGTGCFVHWIMIVLTAIFFLYQVFRFILGRHRKVQVMEFVPAGVYVVLMLVALAFGDCYIDFIMMLGGTVIAIAGVFLTLKQYKRSMNEDF